MRRDQRFSVVMSKTERAMLQRLAQHEHIPAAAVVRRLVWREAEERGLLPPTDAQGQAAQAEVEHG
jgi:hypothetical protein